MLRPSKQLMATAMAGFATFLFLLSSTSAATELQYQLTGTASGSLNGASFSEDHFVLTGIGDLGVAVIGSNANAIVLSPVGIQIDGVGTDQFSPDFGFTGLHHTIGHHPNLEAAFGDGPNDLLDFSSPAFNSWDYLSAQGPLSVDLTFAPGSLYGASVAIPGSAGDLYFTDASNLILTVTSVPEPGTATLAGAALIGLLVLTGRPKSTGLHR